MQRVSDMLGKVIDCYKIETVLGKGGMGVVYKAVDTSLDKVVALKVMNPLLSEDERFLGRFKAEAKALGRLHHPNIVSVFALRYVDHHLFIVMEFVEGETLADVLVRLRGPMPWQDVLPILKQALQAIDYAHNEQIIHRDIKPHNIMLAHDGKAKVTDFGLAKIQAVHTDSMIATRTGFTGGTLYYMPPEQLEGLLHVDHHGDIYGLGMTFYELLAGRTPFDKLSSEFAILKAIDAHDIPPLNELNEEVPAPLSDIVMKAIERIPTDRYPTAGDMLADLEAWEAGEDPKMLMAARTKPPARSTAVLADTAVSPPRKRASQSAFRSLKDLMDKGVGWYSAVLDKRRESRKKRTLAGGKTVITTTPPQAAPRQAIESPPEPEVPLLPVQPPAQEKEPEPLPPSPPPAMLPLVSTEPVAEAPELAAEASEPAAEAPELAAEAPEASPDPEPAPESRAVRRLSPQVWRRAGAAAGLLLVVVLAYLGIQGFPSNPAAEADSSAVAERATALLSIDTVPIEASVFVDGEQVGRTPLIDYEVKAGTTALHIEKQGYLALDTSITLVMDQTPRFTFELQAAEVDVEEEEAPRAVAMLSIRSDPDGADVLLDGEIVGQTPLTLQDPELGEHQLVLRKRGYRAHSQTINVEPGSSNPISATLTAVTGTLEITVRPFGDIYIDEIMKAQGTAEPYAETLGGGTYRIRVMHPEYGRWERQVSIDTSGTQAVLFDFEQELEVAITSEPDGAEILVDGQPVRKRTPDVIRVRPGRRTIAVRRRGYVMEGAAQVLTLERNRTDQPLHFTLRAIQ